MEKTERKFLKDQAIKHPSLKNLYKEIQADLDKVEEKLKLFSSSSNKIISEISSYLFQKAGKRIRPALVILCSKLFGYKEEEHILMSALVETIHTASLIHDDIIDNSDTRRGKPTVHSRWGSNITVLLGDYLYIKTIGLSLTSKHREIVKIFTDASTAMIDGELKEYSLSGNLELKENVYLDILNQKTATLFSASCRIGGTLGSASKKETDLLAEYGTNLGISFQIIDDLLDYTGDKKTLGKPTLSDLNEGRITLPLIYTLNNAGESDRKEIIRLYKEKGIGGNSSKEILDIIKSNGALDYTYQRAVDFSNKSQEILKKLPDSNYRTSLHLIPEFILYRNR
jgi:octaprenyl-diphosphate synthase